MSLDVLDLRRLSSISKAKALLTVASEWIAIVLSIVIYLYQPNPIIYLAVVLFIGARQHALAILAHDASHYRLLPSRTWNDWTSSLLLNWPLFFTLEGFRKVHGLHHRFLNEKYDGNRFLWNTHDVDGKLADEWRYPKAGWTLVRMLARKACFATGVQWICRGLSELFNQKESTWILLLRALYYLVIAGALSYVGAWREFLMLWLVPLCTWQVVAQHIRLIVEHSNVMAHDTGYRSFRTTIPTALESLFILPCNVGYHVEHHLYPSVPFYNLPDLHSSLMRIDSYSRSANICRSLRASLSEVTSLPDAPKQRTVEGRRTRPEAP